MKRTSIYFIFMLLSVLALSCTYESKKKNKPSINIDLDNKVEITEVLKMDGVENAYPHWSKDGMKILFQSNRSGNWQIYIMDKDGTNQKAITFDEFNNNFPCWSPDNNSITFVSDRTGNQDIYVMDADGKNTRQLTKHPGIDIHPYWSPDGSVILFNSSRYNDNFEIMEIRPDGSDLKRITFSPDHETCAKMSPLGDRIVFLKGVPEGTDDIYIMNRDGSNQQNLTADSFRDGWPTWSHDGEKIIFSSYRSGTFCIYSMSFDGNQLEQITITTPPKFDARADILDGKLVFNRQDGATIGIYTTTLNQ